MGAAKSKIEEKIEEKIIEAKEEAFDKANEDKAKEVESHAEKGKKYPRISLSEPENNKLRPNKDSDPSDGFSTNQLTTTRYTFYNFLPKNLFEQFRKTSNFYFTLIVVIAFIPQISPISPWTGLSSIVFILTTTAINEGYLDYKRYKSDRKINKQQVTVIDGAGKRKQIACEDIRVGDLVYIECDQPIPADLVVLATAMPHGMCYVETAQLDGETNLKDRKTVELFSDQEAERRKDISRKKLVKEIISLEADIEVSMPNTSLGDFQGNIILGPSMTGKVNKNKDNGKKVEKKSSYAEISLTPEHKRKDKKNQQQKQQKDSNKIPLTIKQFLYRGSMLRNTQWAIGVAVYCGPDTKYALNQAAPKSKFSSIDLKMNKIVTFLFVVQLILCGVATFSSRIWEARHEGEAWYLGPSSSPTIEATKNFFVYFVLLSWIIPMSLFVSLEIVKVVQGFLMEHDENMCFGDGELDETGMKVRNNSLNDELGLVKYVFSDKTGTLTENNMKLKKFSIGGYIYSKKMLAEKLNVENSKGLEEISHEEVNKEDSDTEELTKEEQKETEKEGKGQNEKLEENLKEFMLCMSLCHTVVVDIKTEEEDDDDHNNNKDQKDNDKKEEKTGGSPSEKKITKEELVEDEDAILDVADEDLVYKGQSPDEEALVKACRDLGYILKGNKVNGPVLKIENDLKEFEVLRVLEFSGERKRMSVIIKGDDNKKILYCKGADSVILERLGQEKEGSDLEKTKKHLELFSKDGLRTLLLAKREISDEEYQNLDKKAQEAETSMEKRQEKLEEVYEEIEKDLILLGCTAIEDKLQEEVPETIDFLLKAGIHLWVITGDKQETAINIGRSSNLIPKDAEIFKLNAKSEDEVKNLINEFLDKVPQEKKDLKNRKSEKHQDSDEEKDSQIFCLATDGDTLKLILKQRESRLGFLELVEYCDSVICSRVTPLIKAKVVRLVRSHAKGVTLAIGDGANDVSMIQEANIGVGLFGKEGSQAARSGDYAIRQFKHLKRLLVVHGRYSLVRNSSLIHYSIYKNAAFALVQFWYAFWCAFSGVRIYNDWMMLFFNILFTSVPTVFLAIFEKDLKEEPLMEYPSLYRALRTGYVFNYKTSALWWTAALWHSMVLYFVAMGIFRNDAIFADGQTAGLWSLGLLTQTFAVVVVLLKIALEVRYWVKPTHFAIWGSLIIYFVSLAVISLFPSYFPSDYFVFEKMATSFIFWLSLIFVIVACLYPDVTYKYAKRVFFPHEWQIVQEKYLLDNSTHKDTVFDERSPLLETPKLMKKSQFQVKRNTSLPDRSINV